MPVRGLGTRNLRFAADRLVGNAKRRPGERADTMDKQQAQVAVPVLRLAAAGAAPPLEYLSSWREVAVALGWPPACLSGRKGRRMRAILVRDGAPIYVRSRGSQPRALASQLLRWFEALPAAWANHHHP
jgi:hypothetical protein